MVNRKELIKIILTLGVLIFSAIFLFKNRDSFQEISRFNVIEVSILIITLLLFWMFTSFRLKILMEIFSISLKVNEWIGLSIISKFYSYFLPLRGGLALRALYLKRVYSFNYLSFASSISSLMLFNVFVNILIILLLIFSTSSFDWVPSFLKSNIKSNSLIVFILVGIIAMAILFKYRNHSIFNMIFGSLNLRILKTRLLSLTFTQLSIRLLFALPIYLAFIFLDSPVPFFECLFITTIIALSTLISVTPGNIGITEAIIIGSSSFLSYDFDQGVLISTVLRSIEIIIIFIMGFYFSKILSIKFTKS